MNQEELVRYSRNIKLPEIGEVGQEKLLASKVLVIGAGGLGSPILLYLAASGIGTIGVIDNDKIELSNLQRQIIHETSDIKRNKAESAADAIHDLNPDVKLEVMNFRLDEKNAAEIIKKYDIVADGSDNAETRFLVNDTCFHEKKTLVSGAINRFDGQVYTFKPYLGNGHPCYCCLYPEIPPAGTIPTCSESGILSPVAGVIGSLQAAEIIKELLGVGESLSGFMLKYDALAVKIQKTSLPKDKSCKLCSNNR